jgi:hypothetical protein
MTPIDIWMVMDMDLLISITAAAHERCRYMMHDMERGARLATSLSSFCSMGPSVSTVGASAIFIIGCPIYHHIPFEKGEFSKLTVSVKA